ncbi:unnamed protein product [Vicia faba]|uniref:Uncharacterized protein n=1 Tax=Vicia faba TaxID=3906 RepID=A0AAV0YZR1_VICFA|nr:unnamed protein product [Vicia faba]
MEHTLNFFPLPCIFPFNFHRLVCIFLFKISSLTNQNIHIQFTETFTQITFFIFLKTTMQIQDQQPVHVNITNHSTDFTKRVPLDEANALAHLADQHSTICKIIIKILEKRERGRVLKI